MPQSYWGEPFTEKNKKSEDLKSTHGNRALKCSIETTEMLHFLSDKSRVRYCKKKAVAKSNSLSYLPHPVRKKVSKNIPHLLGSKDSFRTGEKGQSVFTQDKRDSFRCPSCLWGNHKIK